MFFRKIFLFFFLQITFCLLPTFIFSQGTWVQKANFGGAIRDGAVGFSIGTKGYIGTGQNSSGYLKDFWEYDPSANVWTQKANFGGNGKVRAIGFSIGQKGYIGFGQENSPVFTTATKDFWEYDQPSNTWVQKGNFSSNVGYASTAFSIGNYGYLSIVSTTQFWQYNPTNDIWIQKANFPGSGTWFAVGFSIGNYGYMGTGWNTSSMFNDFWEYNPSTNSWTQKANFGGTVRDNAVGFSISTKGYLGTGWNGSNGFNDFWEYNPSTNIWTQKANFGAGNRRSASCFSIDCKGFIGTGNNLGYQNDFWEYTPDNIGTITASINSNATTICSGNTLTISASGGPSYSWSTGSTNNPLIVSPSVTTTYSVIVSDVCGSDTASVTITVNPTPVALITGNTSICIGDSTILTASGGTSYSWNTGSTNSAIIIIPTSSNTYSVIVSNSTCTNNASINVTVTPSPSVNLTGTNNICNGQTATLIASGGTNYVWSTGLTNNSIVVSPSATTTYSVIVSDVCGSDTASLSVTVSSPFSQFSFNTIDIDTCNSVSTVQFTDNSTNANSWVWNFGDGNLSSNQNPSHIFSSGNYLVTLISNNTLGCSNTTQQNINILSVSPSPLFIPNAFSPNGDNENDLLHIYGICIKEIKLLIYNRWGETVFETTKITDSWDGTFNGEKLHSQVFTYLCKITTTTGSEVMRKGNITLVR